MGAFLLAEFVKGDSRAWKALYVATRRFGVQTGTGDDHDELGDLAYEASGNEGILKRYAAVEPLAKELPAKLDAFAAAGDLEGGRAAYRKVGGPLNDLTVALPSLALGTLEARLWQTSFLERLSALRVEVEWEYAMFQRRFGESDEATGEDLAPGIADGRQREAFALLGTMQSYAKLEQRVFADHSGMTAQVTDLQAAIQPLHKAWRRVYERWVRADPDADEALAPTPDWYAYRETVRALAAGASPDDVSRATRPSREAWGQ
jgi:hypothetical protein